ncbi:unnamed protein product [Triticum turgidum subsp. durum]|uniref:Cytochrome P450 n=1 Tax=Triticum turgidum subsp. durum TaxID=4567 RepID=A0A9R1RR45_TRITD|nr:unnamed protein product [Triticum turgidum subsp. durum]
METTLARSVAHVDRYLSAVIKTRKLELAGKIDGSGATTPHDDLLSRFMRKGTYSDDSLQHVALNFILAGRDTSSVALSWFFWLVSTHPDVERKIMKNIAGSILLRHRLAVAPGHRVEQKMSLTLFMKHGLRMVVATDGTRSTWRSMDIAVSILRLFEARARDRESDTFFPALMVRLPLSRRYIRLCSPGRCIKEAMQTDKEFLRAFAFPFDGFPVENLCSRVGRAYGSGT